MPSSEELCEGQGGPHDRVDAVLQASRIVSLAIMALSGTNGYLRLCGDIVGDPVPHLMVVLCSLLMVTVSVMSRMGAIRPQPEIFMRVNIFRLTLYVYSSYCFLVPWSSVSDQTIVLLVTPFTDSITMLLPLYFTVELGFDMKSSASVYPRFMDYVPSACGIARVVFMHGSASDTPLILPMALITCTVYASAVKHVVQLIEANFSTMRRNLRSEVTRTTAAMRKLQQSQVELESASNGMSRMLTALCDVVVYLDADLCIRNASGQLYEFLMPQSAGSASGSASNDLEGRQLLDFVDRREDQELVRGSLATSRATECPDGSGAAGALNIGIKNSSGDASNVQVFYVRLCGIERSSYLLGLHVTNQHERPPPPSSDDRDVEIQSSAVAQQGHPAPPSSVAPEIEVNPSRLAVHFDAGSDDFDIVGHCPFLGPHRDLRSRPQSLLNWVGCDERADFEEWVVQSIQAAPWDSATTSEPYPTPISFSLPKVRPRHIHASKVWLDMDPPDHDGDIEATLWLEGVRVQSSQQVRRVVRLATVNEVPGEQQTSSDDGQHGGNVNDAVSSGSSTSGWSDSMPSAAS